MLGITSTFTQFNGKIVYTSYANIIVDDIYLLHVSIKNS